VRWHGVEGKLSRDKLTAISNRSDTMSGSEYGSDYSDYYYYSDDMSDRSIDQGIFEGDKDKVNRSVSSRPSIPVEARKLAIPTNGDDTVEKEPSEALKKARVAFQKMLNSRKLTPARIVAGLSSHAALSHLHANLENGCNLGRTLCMKYSDDGLTLSKEWLGPDCGKIERSVVEISLHSVHGLALTNDRQVINRYAFAAIVDGRTGEVLSNVYQVKGRMDKKEENVWQFHQVRSTWPSISVLPSLYCFLFCSSSSSYLFLLLSTQLTC
jgi:hypothetical protein